MRRRYERAWRPGLKLRHPERDIEDRIVAHFQGHADTLSVTRQMRFDDGSRADIVIEALLPDVLETRIVTVVEVKAIKAGLRALEQLNRYLICMRSVIAGEGDGFEETVLAGMLAAPRFSPEIEDYAARCAWDETPFSILRVAA